MKDALFPPWTSVIGFVLGAFFGSFLNMVIYRLPRNLSFSEPKRSFCPNCKHSLDWIDLAPILSWVSTGGNCRYCKKPISPRYMYVEILTGFLFAGVWFRYMCLAPNPDVKTAGFYAFVVCCLVAVIFIDAEMFIIPDEINAAIFVAAVVYQGIQGQWITALEGALLGWGLLWGIALLGRLLFGKDAMGDGDIKMMRGIGALIGPTLLLANIAIAVVLGLIGGIAGMVIARRRKKGQESAAPEVDDPPYEPTPIWLVFLSGAWYLLCLDIVSLVVPPLDKWIASKLPAETVDEEDDWKPTATTIPFGPYLAAGALLCMLFQAEITTAMQNYWNKRTGRDAALNWESPGESAGQVLEDSFTQPRGVEALQTAVPWMPTQSRTQARRASPPGYAPFGPPGLNLAALSSTLWTGERTLSASTVGFAYGWPCSGRPAYSPTRFVVAILLRLG